MSVLAQLLVASSVIVAPATSPSSTQVIQNVEVKVQENFDLGVWHAVVPVHPVVAITPPVVEPPPPPLPQPQPQPVPLVTVRFDTAKWHLNAEQKQVLKEILPVAGWEYFIEGSADPRGTKSYNAKLAAKRAKSVETWLLANGYKLGLVTNSGARDVPPKDWAKVRQTRILGFQIIDVPATEKVEK